MVERSSRIYTRTGDKGMTGLGNRQRVKKSSVRIEAIGDIDELNCCIGYLLTKLNNQSMVGLLLNIQNLLFDVGAELSLADENLIVKEDVAFLENSIDSYNKSLPKLDEFILPGGSEASSICHLTRAVCRRAERKLVLLGQAESVNECTRMAINRISDLLFILARVLVYEGGHTETRWNKSWRDNL